MSKCIKLYNVEYRDKPFIFVFSNKLLLHCLIDTGASIPIFTLGEEKLVKYFPNAKIDPKFKAKLIGIGNGRTDVVIYDIDEMVIQSGSEKIVFKNFKLACCNKEELNISLILPGSLFDEMNLMFMHLNMDYRQTWIEYEYETYYGNIELNEYGGLKRVFAQSKDHNQCN